MIDFLKILAWNCNSIKNEKKFLLESFCNDNKVDIICLQETCLKPFHSSQPKFKNYNCLRYYRLDSQKGVS